MGTTVVISDQGVVQTSGATSLTVNGPVTMLEADEVPDDALVVGVSMMGAPTVMVEKLPSGGEHREALNALSEFLGEQVSHLVCVEAGGINSMVPFAVSAATNLPLIDADAMGRAFPELQMKLPGLEGINTAPMALADEKGNISVIRTAENRWSERLARALTIEMGCSAATAQLVMRGNDVRRSMSLGTLTRAEAIGSAIRRAQEQHGNPVSAAISAIGGYLLFAGKIVDVLRTTSRGFALGNARIAGIDQWSGSELELDFQNEHLVARRDNQVVATVPDLIAALDNQTGEPVNTEAMRFGLRVSVLGAPCDPRWRSPAGLDVVGPRYFGYNLEYRPVEELVSA